MNIDAQFPQPIAPAVSQRPPDKPVEQATTRPVENPRPSDGISEKPQREAKKTRNEDAQATQLESEARRELLETEDRSSQDSRSTPTSPENRIQQAMNTEPAPVGDLLDVIV